MNIVECQGNLGADVIYKGENAVLGDVVDDFRVRIHMWHANKVLLVAPRNIELAGK